MDAFAETIAKYRPKGVLIDSNLLLLLLIGSVERNLVIRFKRTRQFALEDYDLLARLLWGFASVVTTPHVLAEVGNLATALEGRYRADFFANLARLIDVLDERHLPAREAASDEWFSRLGITDTAVTILATGQLLVLTVDAALVNCIAARNGDVINFNHLRAANWT